MPSSTQAIQDRADIEPNDPVSAEHATAWKLTPDVYHQRTGRSDPDSELFHGTGVTLTYDREPRFFRLALDPHANFTASNMTCLAVEIRF